MLWASEGIIAFTTVKFIHRIFKRFSFLTNHAAIFTCVFIKTQTCFDNNLKNAYFDGGWPKQNPRKHTCLLFMRTSGATFQARAEHGSVSALLVKSNVLEMFDNLLSISMEHVLIFGFWHLVRLCCECVRVEKIVDFSVSPWCYACFNSCVWVGRVRALCCGATGAALFLLTCRTISRGDSY